MARLDASRLRWVLDRTVPAVPWVPVREDSRRAFVDTRALGAVLLLLTEAGWMWACPRVTALFKVMTGKCASPRGRHSPNVGAWGSPREAATQPRVVLLWQGRRTGH